jgi:hypothetical protein
MTDNHVTIDTSAVRTFIFHVKSEYHEDDGEEQSIISDEIMIMVK